MGREVRRVRGDWEHPRRYVDGSGGFIPLLDGCTYADAVEQWNKAVAELGLQGAIDDMGGPPDAKDYMPRWTDEEADHLMMYEDTSEGTPISPAFKTPEELARWLADNKASAFGDQTATYEQWLSTIHAGWAPSAVLESGVLKSGVAASSKAD